MINKETVLVPKGIRYLSEWSDFKLPETPTIINKQICGCGFTEWCLGSPQNIILCSPRRMLLENKDDQHEGQENLLYARNDLEVILRIDKDTNSPMPSAKNDNREEIAKKTAEEIRAAIEKLHREITEHSTKCAIKGMPCKIMVTYDSFRHVREALGGMFQNFYVVVDEWQSIFVDARFKSSTEMEFLTTLQGIDKLCFVSATPMVDEYLEMMDEFKDLPFIELDWKTLDPGRVMRPMLDVYPCRSIMTVAEKYIRSYLDGDFKKKLYKDDNGNIQELESKELVIYVNSVKNICEIIKRNGLTYDNCNVLCAKTADNKAKVKAALGITKKNSTPEVYDAGGIGKVPKKGMPHKMFTLCTRTVYLGADFYSTCARSLVLSDANSKCLSVDISLDLPQIIGRQRLESNPWINMAEFYFKTSVRTDKELAEFLDELKNKKLETERLLKAYTQVSDDVKGSLANNYEYVANSKNYRDDYVAVNNHAGSEKIPVFNNLVMLSDMRTYEIQKLDYKDRFSVLARINYDNDIRNTESLEALDEFNSYGQFTDKMRVLCDHPDIVEMIPYDYSNYYYALGPERIKACQYRKYLLDEEINKAYSVQDNASNLQSAVVSSFTVGCRYTKAEIKSKLKEIYDKLGIKLVPKASMIKDYFVIKDAQITNKETGKRDNGFEIIRKKS